MMEFGLAILGLGIAAVSLAAILWSIMCPSQRLWPPMRYTALTPIIVWGPTFTLFGILIALGVMGWGELPFSVWERFGLGLPLVLIGNIAVWFEVFRFGIPQTSGAVGDLRTDGLYRFSRNPQYVADILMVVGWMLLSASLSAVLVGALAIIVLMAAPFSEEAWLREKYGAAFAEYSSRVRRFL